MQSLSDPIIWRGIERIAIVLGALFFAHLGFQLYKIGQNTGPAKLDLKSPVIRFALSGVGPGLMFMAFGAVVLVFAPRFSATATKRGDADTVEAVQYNFRDLNTEESDISRKTRTELEQENWNKKVKCSLKRSGSLQKSSNSCKSC